MYSRASLCAFLATSDKMFIIKTVTDGMNVGVKLMSDARWEGESWTCERLAEEMEEFILPKPSNSTLGTSNWYSRWGVQYEQRGLMIPEISIRHKSHSLP